MASAELSRRVRKEVGFPPLSEMSDHRRREFHEVLLDADSFEDLPGNGRRRFWRQGRAGRSCASSGGTGSR
jgi:hypothetical protein